MSDWAWRGIAFTIFAVLMWNWAAVVNFVVYDVMSFPAQALTVVGLLSACVALIIIDRRRR